MRGKERGRERGVRRGGSNRNRKEDRQNFPGIQEGLNLVLPLVSCEKL